MVSSFAPAKSPTGSRQTVAGSALVSYWADKSSATTTWTLPAAVTLRNLCADAPAFPFIADESPLHRKLGVFENRG